LLNTINRRVERLDRILTPLFLVVNLISTPLAWEQPNQQQPNQQQLLIRTMDADEVLTGVIDRIGLATMIIHKARWDTALVACLERYRSQPQRQTLHHRELDQQAVGIHTTTTAGEVAVVAVIHTGSGRQGSHGIPTC
jgi:hypothetical protein